MFFTLKKQKACFCPKIIVSWHFPVKTDVILGFISHLEMSQPSAILQVNKKSVCVKILQREDLFLLLNPGKLAFSSTFQLNTGAKLGLISHLELSQSSAITQHNKKSVSHRILERKDLFLL